MECDEECKNVWGTDGGEAVSAEEDLGEGRAEGHAHGRGQGRAERGAAALLERVHLLHIDADTTSQSATIKIIVKEESQCNVHGTFLTRADRASLAGRAHLALPNSLPLATSWSISSRWSPATVKLSPGPVAKQHVSLVCECRAIVCVPCVRACAVCVCVVYRRRRGRARG